MGLIVPNVLNSPSALLMNAYCVNTEKEPGTVNFVFNYELIRPTATPQELGMKDQDQIYAQQKPTSDKPAQPAHLNLVVLSEDGEKTYLKLTGQLN